MNKTILSNFGATSQGLVQLYNVGQVRSTELDNSVCRMLFCMHVRDQYPRLTNQFGFCFTLQTQSSCVESVEWYQQLIDFDRNIIVVDGDSVKLNFISFFVNFVFELGAYVYTNKLAFSSKPQHHSKLYRMWLTGDNSYLLQMYKSIVCYYWLKRH